MVTLVVVRLYLPLDSVRERVVTVPAYDETKMLVAREWVEMATSRIVVQSECIVDGEW